jgi:hypothetical protein
MCSREDDPSAIEMCDALCGCAGAEYAFSCAFDPSCKRCEDNAAEIAERERVRVAYPSRTVAESWHNHCLAMHRLRDGVILFCDLPAEHNGDFHRDQTTEAVIWHWGRGLDQAHPAQQAHRDAHV